MPESIETAHLILYPWRETNLDEYARMLADPEVMRHITHEYGPLSHEEAKLAHVRMLRLWGERGFGAWAAVEKTSGRWVGKIGLDYLDRWPGPDKIEVERQLNSAFWGKGYATEGARAVIRHALEDLGLERLIAITVPYHAASRRVMEKCGLTYQGTATVTDHGSGRSDRHNRLPRVIRERPSTDASAEPSSSANSNSVVATSRH